MTFKNSCFVESTIFHNNKKPLNLAMLCREYADSVVVGELCEDFCVTKAIKPNTCLPMHFGKEVVFTATWGNKEVTKSNGHMKIE